MNDSHYQAFLEEMKELLNELEFSLIELEKDNENSELLDKTFRAMHTIKGTSGMFDCEDVANFTHNIETVFDFIRNGDLEINKEIINLTLQAKDHIEFMLYSEELPDENDEVAKEKILKSFKEILNDIKDNENDLIDSEEENKVSGNRTYLIEFIPDEDLFLTGNDPALLLEELKSLGNSIVVGKFNETPPLSEIKPELNYAKWKVLLNADCSVQEIRDVFIFVEDNCKLEITELKDFILPTDEGLKDLLYKNLKANFEVSVNELQILLSCNKTKSSDEINKSKKNINTAKSSIRVNSEKLDELVNLVGELVIVQAGLNQLAEKKYDPELKSLAEQIDRLTSDLRDSTLNIRMLQIGSTFSKFSRLVRDLCNELNKDIELETSGGETELDKTVLEKLNDPLVHIIRNSVDHGIETPEIRKDKGKQVKGKIRLAAYQSGGNVVIEVKDDGKGLDKITIKNKAISQGIISEDDNLTDQQIFKLIFHPGFSTAQNVSNLSGRGVGMDVVKTAIEELRGTIKVESETNVGTTISLILPLTLAIIDGLLVNVGEEYFVISLPFVEECIELDQATIDKSNGRNIINVRDEIVPYINLRERFSVTGKRPELEQIVIVKIENDRIGFVVDEVVGQHQTVIKKLGKAFENVDGVSGATILGNGTVALILDIVKIWKEQEKFEKEIYVRD